MREIGFVAVLLFVLAGCEKKPNNEQVHRLIESVIVQVMGSNTSFNLQINAVRVFPERNGEGRISVTGGVSPTRNLYRNTLESGPINLLERRLAA
jgi:hypothetical protein